MKKLILFVFFILFSFYITAETGINGYTWGCFPEVIENVVREDKIINDNFLVMTQKARQENEEYYFFDLVRVSKFGITTEMYQYTQYELAGIVKEVSFSFYKDKIKNAFLVGTLKLEEINNIFAEVKKENMDINHKEKFLCFHLSYEVKYQNFEYIEMKVPESEETPAIYIIKENEDTLCYIWHNVIDGSSYVVYLPQIN